MNKLTGIAGAVAVAAAWGRGRGRGGGIRPEDVVDVPIDPFRAEARA